MRLIKRNSTLECHKYNHRCTKEAKESNTFYKADNAAFEVQESESMDYVNSFDLPCSCKAKTLQELLDKVKEKLYMEDREFYWSVNIESSALQVSYLGNNDSNLASKSEREAWKNGNLELYTIDGYISIKKVMGEIDVPEEELKALANKNHLDID